MKYLLSMWHLSRLLKNKKMNGATISVAVLFLLLLLPEGSTAQVTGDIDPELPGIQQIVAPVKVDGKILFNVRGISSFSAEQRAATISKRIKEAAADPTISSDSVKIIAGEDHILVNAGSRFIMNIYGEDGEVEQINKEVLATIIRTRIMEAMKLYRHMRSRPVLIQNSFKAFGALVLLTLFLFLILWLLRKINAGLQKRIKAKIDKVENISFSLIRANQLWVTYKLIFILLKIIVIIFSVAMVIDYILGLYPWTNNVSAYTLNLLLNPFISIGKGFLDFLPNLIYLIIIYLVSRYLLKLGKMMFTGIREGRINIKGFDPDWAMPTYRIVRILVTVFALIFAYPYIPGSGSDAFKGISVFFGVLFSLGSSSFISNLIAGYTITYRRAFKNGDRIQVGDRMGFVEEQEILVTRLRTIKNEEITIPNSTLLSSDINNFSAKAKNRGLIIHTTVGIGYETPWRLVDEMLKRAADRTGELLKDPPPFVLKLSLGDFAINYELNAYCNDAFRLEECYSDLHQNILDIFNENNVQIMTPAYVFDPDNPKVVPKDQWNTTLAGEPQKKETKN